MTEETKFPIRINRYLELQGVTTRRGADDLTKKGQVLVNGKPAVLGYQVKESDKVEVLGLEEKNHVYLMYNKPRGLATEDIKVKLPSGISVFPLGRLDKDSEGLIILTNDGRATDRLLNPKYEHEKEYMVEVREKVSPMYKKILEGGVISRVAERGRFKNEKLKAKNVKIEGPNSLTIVLTEGKKHQIRRMLSGAHLTVKSLRRVRIMDIKLFNLRSNQHRELKGEELRDFLANIGLV
ncbi:MAG TPA: pseudouridine synthase [Candidatus Paceibacterota bacterium]|nr:pseudouridine synthase [Candidatus Paceibacterota bacterium]